MLSQRFLLMLTRPRRRPLVSCFNCARLTWRVVPAASSFRRLPSRSPARPRHLCLSPLLSPFGEMHPAAAGPSHSARLRPRVSRRASPPTTCPSPSLPHSRSTRQLTASASTTLLSSSRATSCSGATKLRPCLQPRRRWARWATRWGPLCQPTRAQRGSRWGLTRAQL